MRGEYDALVASEIVEKGSPPHARGIPDTKTQKWQQAGITPACAGNTHKYRLQGRLIRDHPRMRGEYFARRKSFLYLLGSPPHARGIRGRTVDDPGGTGITPACAGNTNTVLSWMNCTWDHPRMRGEYTKNPL